MAKYFSVLVLVFALALPAAAQPQQPQLTFMAQLQQMVDNVVHRVSSWIPRGVQANGEKSGAMLVPSGVQADPQKSGAYIIPTGLQADPQESGGLLVTSGASLDPQKHGAYIIPTSLTGPDSPENQRNLLFGNGAP